MKVIEVDYDSVGNLTAALGGQDAVICTLGIGTDASVQNHLIDAAVAAKVKRFIPDEFSFDTQNPLVRQLLVFRKKLDVENHLEERVRKSGLTYTYIINSALFDWGLQHNFILDMSQYKPTIYNSGEELFSTTTTTTVAKAVVGVLTHYDETKNRAVYVQDAVISQNKILAIAKKYMPDKTWELVYINLAEIKAESDAKVAKEIYDMPIFYSYLFVAVFEKGYGGRIGKTDNELFGIKEMTEEEIEKVVKAYLPKN